MAYGVYWYMVYARQSNPQPRLPFLLVKGVSCTVRSSSLLLSAKLIQQRAHERRKERKTLRLLLSAKLTGPAKLTGYPATCS